MRPFWEEDTAEAGEETRRATNDPSLDALLEPANVASAWQRVRRNRGCAGVDGVSIEELEPGFDQEWRRVERDLRSGEYRPQPLLRVRVPKPTGGERLLGIPAVIDRVVQQAAAQALAPRWEPRFSPRSFAYRPGRGCRDALRAVESALNRGADHVLHVDIENFFDSVPHTVALAALANDLTDHLLASLVRRTLSCGVYESGLVRPTTIGLAQGSPLSPLLANVVLHRLDQRLETAGWEFARYADDCLVMLPGPQLGPKARETVVAALAGLGLNLNERKTAFGPFTEARFLGFAFRRDALGRAVRTVSPEALAEATESLLRFVRTFGSGAGEAANETAEMLRGWLAYFYTPNDEAILKGLADRVGTAWRERFGAAALPECLRWEALSGANRSRERVDYSGHFQDARASGGSVDWAQTARCLLWRALRSRWWHLEYDLGRGRRPGVRLCLGRHQINLRF
jgi:RNA-directed DNA polymerase